MTELLPKLQTKVKYCTQNNIFLFTLHILQHFFVILPPISHSLKSHAVESALDSSTPSSTKTLIKTAHAELSEALVAITKRATEDEPKGHSVCVVGMRITTYCRKAFTKTLIAEFRTSNTPNSQK